MRFQAEELSIFKMLMGFLRDKNLFETLNSLQLEIGQAEEDVGSDLLYLQRIVLQGRWDDVLLFLKPFSDKPGEKYEKLEYTIHRQQLLEALSWQGGGGHRHALLPWKPVKSSDHEIDGELEIEVIVNLLKSLERSCPPHEFNSLCLCLTLEKLSDNPDFAFWTVSQGRLDAFQSIKNIVSPLLEVNRKAIVSASAKAKPLRSLRESLGEVPKGGLLCMLAMALAYQVQKQRESASGRGHSVGADDNLKTVFDGSILLVEGVGGDVLLEPLDPFMLPSIAVTGAIANTLYARDSNLSYDYVAPLSSSSIARKNRGDGILGEGPHMATAGRHQHQSTDSDTLQVQVPSQSQEQVLSRGTVVRIGAGTGIGIGTSASENYRRSHAAVESGISSSEMPDGSREATGRHSGSTAAASSSPERRVSARAAPVAWTVEGEPKREKNVENESISKAPQSRSNRRATVVSARSPEHLISRERVEHLDGAHAQVQEIRKELDRDMDRSYVADPALRQQTHQPSSSSAGRNRRDTITNVDNSSRLGKANVDGDRDRDRQGERLPAKQVSPSLDLKSVIDSTLLLQAECPLRCVCSLSDQINPSKPGEKPLSSSSWMVAVGSNDKSVKVLRISDAIPGRTVCASAEIVSEYPEAHRGSIYAMDWRASCEGQGGPGLLASASNDKAIRILNVATGTMSAPLKGHTGTIRSVVFQDKFGRDSSVLLASAGAGDNRPRLWDVSTGASHSVLAAHTDAVHGLAWLSGQGAGDRLLLSGCEGGIVMAHDTRMSSPAWTLDLSHQPQMVEAGGTGICCFSALCLPAMGRASDGLIVAGCTGGFVCVVNTTDRSVAAVHRPHTDDVRSIALHGGGSLRAGGSSFGLVTTSFDGLGAIWCVNQSISGLYSFQLESMLRGHEDKILGVCSTVRNKSLEILTTGADGKAILWTQKTHK